MALPAATLGGFSARAVGRGVVRERERRARREGKGRGSCMVALWVDWGEGEKRKEKQGIRGGKDVS